MSGSTNPPEVSILIVARNTAPFIGSALASARAQSVADVEVLVVDDGSTDGTADIVRWHAAQDVRVRLIAGSCKGLSAVRNLSLDACRGRFAAILDSDDILHPRHVERLLAAQRAHGDEICAANMVEFQGDGKGLRAGLFADGKAWRAERRIGLDEFLAGSMFGSRAVSPGYLKPLFDMAFMRRHGLRYDERLRIGEDFDLVLRAMLAGARYRFLPAPGYYYRRHAASTSHRLSPLDLEGLLMALDAVAAAAGAAGEAAPLLSARRDNLAGALAHLEVIAALKGRQWRRALHITAGNPVSRRLTLTSLREAAAKRIGLDFSRLASSPWLRGEEGRGALRQSMAALGAPMHPPADLSIPAASPSPPHSTTTPPRSRPA